MRTHGFDLCLFLKNVIVLVSTREPRSFLLIYSSKPRCALSWHASAHVQRHKLIYSRNISCSSWSTTGTHGSLRGFLGPLLFSEQSASAVKEQAFLFVPLRAPCLGASAGNGVSGRSVATSAQRNFQPTVPKGCCSVFVWRRFVERLGGRLW